MRVRAASSKILSVRGSARSDGAGAVEEEAAERDFGLEDFVGERGWLVERRRKGGRS